MTNRKVQWTVLFLIFIHISACLSTRPNCITKVNETNSGDNGETERNSKTTAYNQQKLYKTRTSSILATLLQDEYDKRVRPDEEEKTMDLGLNVYFNTLSSLDEENMSKVVNIQLYDEATTFRQKLKTICQESSLTIAVKSLPTREFDIDLYLRLMWIDSRLNFTHITNATNTDKHILVEPPEQVWLPDVFMENSKHASFHLVTKKNEVLRLWPNGSLFYSVRITAKVSCFMLLYRFPLDEQECIVQFGSYKYTRDEIAVNWRRWRNDPLVQISPKIKLARYTVSGIETRKSVINYGIGGYYDYLLVVIRFQRDVGHYILQQYMPCSYIVILSWVCFWIQADCVGDRISIGVTLVLTIVLLQGSLNTNMPKVSYSKYIDYYFNFCLAFLMGSIIESLIVYKYYKLQQNSSTKTLEPRIGSQSLFLMRTRKENWNWGSMDEKKISVHPSVRSIAGTGTQNDDNMAQKIDRISQVVFPALFTLFNLLYHFYFNITQI